MGANELRHFEHVDGVLAENGFEGLIAVDIALVGWILQVLALDIGPELLCDLGARHRTGTYYDCEFWADFHRLHERGIARRHNFHALKGYGFHYTPSFPYGKRGVHREGV